MTMLFEWCDGPFQELNPDAQLFVDVLEDFLQARKVLRRELKRGEGDGNYREPELYESEQSDYNKAANHLYEIAKGLSICL